MPVEEHLMPGELVLASSANFYATDRRLVRYDPAPIGGRNVEALEYQQITGVRPRIQTRYRLIAMSFVALVLGFVDPLQRSIPVFTVVMVIAGLAGIVYGILNRKTAWEVISPAVRKIDLYRWRIMDDSNQRTQRLVQVVQARIGKPAPAAEEAAPPSETSSSQPSDGQQT